MTPSDSVLFSQEWNVASQISNIPFLNQEYYGKEVLSFKKQLRLLGVVVDLDKSYQLVLDNLKTSYSSTCLSSEAMLLLLRCIKDLESSDRRVQAIKNMKCLKTNLGYRCPSECFLLNPESEWCCLLRVFGSFPILDERFYGSSIFSMENELKKIGVMVDFEEAITEFTHTFKQQASLSSIGKEHVLSFLQCYGKSSFLTNSTTAYAKRNGYGQDSVTIDHRTTAFSSDLNGNRFLKSPRFPSLMTTFMALGYMTIVKS